MTSNPSSNPLRGPASDRRIPVSCSVDRLHRLSQALDEVTAVAVDELDDAGLETELKVLERSRRRIEARVSRCAAVLTDRRAAAAVEAAPRYDGRAGERAAQDTRRQLMDQLDWTPTQAKDAERLGRVLERSIDLSRDVEEGATTPRNATSLARLLDRLDPTTRDAAEQRLLGPARSESPGAFADTCRRVLADLDPDEAAAAEARRHARRTGSVTKTADGMTRVYAELAGVDGALFNQAVEAWRRPDGPGEHRRPDQATADALVAMAQAALEGGRPPTNHGVKPHVVCTLPIQTLIDGAGPVDLEGSTLPLDAIRHLLDGAGWSFVLTGAHGQPITVSRESGAVPVGLWRALQLRDHTCIADGCDIPSRWCDVMHLEVPDRNGGPLDLANTGLGCHLHPRAGPAP